MGPALSPGAVGQEMAACAVLGGVLGAARVHLFIKPLAPSL